MQAGLSARCPRGIVSIVFSEVVNIDKLQRINDQIRVSPVRVVGGDGEQLGILSTEEAIEIARNSGLDLVEVAPTERPPVLSREEVNKRE